jgi:hypothetical protein
MAMASALVVLAACTPLEPDGVGANIVDNPATEAPSDKPEPTEADESEPAPEPTEAAVGTRENPVPLGTKVTMGDYEVAVVEVAQDVTQQNLDANQFNEAPPEGTQYMLVKLEGTYIGADSGNPGWDLSWKLLGNANNTFDTLWEPDNAPDDFFPSCTLDTMFDIGETFPGGSFSGSFCLLVESAQVEGSSVIIEETLAFDDNRVFWATA